MDTPSEIRQQLLSCDRQIAALNMRVGLLQRRLIVRERQVRDLAARDHHLKRTRRKLDLDTSDDEQPTQLIVE